MRVAKVAKATTETELTGIKIAATTGDKFPEMANEIPTMLYKNEMAEVSYPMFSEVLVNRTKLASLSNFDASRTASLAGEKW